MTDDDLAQLILEQFAEMAPGRRYVVCRSHRAEQLRHVLRDKLPDVTVIECNDIYKPDTVYVSVIEEPQTRVQAWVRRLLRKEYR